MLPLIGDVLTWAPRANCRDVDPDWMFAEGRDAHKAARICRDCPVKLECLTYALDNHMDYGVWGGLTAGQRARLRRSVR